MLTDNKLEGPPMSRPLDTPKPPPSTQPATSTKPGATGATAHGCDPVLSVGDVARLVLLSCATVLNWIKTNKLAVRQENGRFFIVFSEVMRAKLLSRRRCSHGPQSKWREYPPKTSAKRLLKVPSGAPALVAQPVRSAVPMITVVGPDRDDQSTPPAAKLPAQVRGGHPHAEIVHSERWQVPEAQLLLERPGIDDCAPGKHEEGDPLPEDYAAENHRYEWAKAEWSQWYAVHGPHRVQPHSVPRAPLDPDQTDDESDGDPARDGETND